MSAQDLNRTSRPFWLCRRCGHWSTSIEHPGEHTQSQHREIPDSLTWHPIRDDLVPMASMVDDQSDTRMRFVPSRLVVEETEPDWDGLVFRRVYRLPPGADVASSDGYRQWTYSVCRGGYERWTATLDPGERVVSE